METIVVSKKKYDLMKAEIEALRHTKLYARLLEFTQNIQKKRFTRSDLGF